MHGVTSRVMLGIVDPVSDHDHVVQLHDDYALLGVVLELGD